MLKKYSMVFLLLSFFFLSTFSISIEDIKPTGLASDYANTLSREEISTLENMLIQVQRNSNIEIGILIIDNTNGMALSDFASKAGNKFGIGDKEAYNGILILISMDDNQWFITAAKGIQGDYPDLKLHDIGKKNLTTNFSQGRYLYGLAGTIQDISQIKILAQENSQQQNIDYNYIIILIIIFVILFIITKGNILFIFLGGSSGSGSGGFSSGGGFSGGGSGGKW